MRAVGKDEFFLSFLAVQALLLWQDFRALTVVTEAVGLGRIARCGNRPYQCV